VHPFWSSYDGKRAWLRLSMGGQPWLELELHGRPSGAHRRGRGGGRGRGRGGHGQGVAGGAMQRGSDRSC
jgi:hypothetical protein